MIQVRIFDKEFGHAKSYSGTNVPKHIHWVREGVSIGAPAFFTNRCLEEAPRWLGKRIAWLTEPPSLMPESYQKVIEMEELFDHILTYDYRLLNRGPKYLYYPLGGSWIPEDIKIPAKTRGVSMISSRKKGCVGYELRHQVAEELGHRIELFGQIVDNPIHCKSEGLLPFRFSIVVENDQLDDYFTEKLIDCLACGTIPFYWGSPSLDKNFDTDSIFEFTSIADLQDKLDRLANEDVYDALMDSIRSNRLAAKQFRIPEDWLFNHYPHLFT